MSKRIEHLSDSPCYKCGKMKECEAKIAKCPMLGDIIDSIMPRADYDFHACSIWRALSMEVENG